MHSTKLGTLIILVLLLSLMTGCTSKQERPPIGRHYDRGRTDNLTEAELKIEKALRDAAKLPAAVEYAKTMFDIAYIIAEDHKNLGFTVRSTESGLVVERGLDTSVEPTIVIPLSDDAIYNAGAFFEDGVLDDREEFLVINAVFKPGWEASYRIPEINDSLARKFMQLDGLIHAVLLNPSNISYRGSVVANQLSVVHSGNQWLVFNGLEGRPDIRMEIGFKEAKEMYRLIVRDLPKASAWHEKKKILERFQELRTRCIVKK